MEDIDGGNDMDDLEELEERYQPFLDAVTAELRTLAAPYEVGWSIGIAELLAVPQNSKGDLQDGRGISFGDDGSATAWKASGLGSEELASVTAVQVSDLSGARTIALAIFGAG